MDYILLMLKISSLQSILILLRITGGQFFTSSCLYSLFGIQKIFQFPTTVPEREKYFPPLVLCLQTTSKPIGAFKTFAGIQFFRKINGNKSILADTKRKQMLRSMLGMV